MVKKLLAMMLVLIMACTALVFAEDAVVADGTVEEIQGDVMLIAEAPVDNTPKVVLEATEPDADGYFTATFTIYNANVLGIQASIAYNKDAIVPVNAETKEETDVFEDFAVMTRAEDLRNGSTIENWCSTIGTKIDNEDGLFAFSVYLDAGQMRENSIVNADGRIACGADGLALYQFNFKKISDADAGLKVAFEKANPNGIILAEYGPNLSYTFEVKMPESLSKENPDVYTYTYEEPVIKSDDSEDSEVPMDQRVRVRANDVIFLQIGNYGTVSDGTLKWVDKENKNVKPYIKDDRTMVPLRFITEELGATVAYDDATRAITITLGETVMGLTVGEKTYTLNGESFEMDCAAEILEDRTFVPVRFVTEALGKSVEWLEDRRMVVITTSSYPWDNENGVEKEVLSKVMKMLMLRDFA